MPAVSYAQNQDEKTGIFYLSDNAVVPNAVLPVFAKAFPLESFTNSPRVFEIP
jgi:hypothetical protein